MTLDAADEVGPVELENLQPNQRRLFFSREGYLDWLRNGEFARAMIENEGVSVAMTLGSEYAVTITATSEAAGAE